LRLLPPEQGHGRHGITKLRAAPPSCFTNLLKVVVMAWERLEAALGLIEEVAAEPRSPTRAMKVWELL